MRAQPAARAEQLGLFALLGLWLAYTRIYPALHALHLTLPACPFYALTGHPCPFCGGTRSYAAMWQGDLGSALRYHPLGPALFLATFAALGCTGWGLLTGRRLQLHLPSRVWRAALVAGALALAVSWALKLFWLGN